MSVITISYGSSTVRNNIAEQVAESLGYTHVGREVLKHASQTYDIPESKLSHAIHHGPSFFGMSETKRKQYIAYILAAGAHYLLQDNIVYHGPGGHVLAQGIAHILKVQIFSSLESRIQFLMENNNIPYEKAEQIVSNDEKSRKKWSKMAFGIDDFDSKLYDLSIDINQIGVDESVKKIAATGQDKKYQPMTYSMQSLKNRECAYRIKSLLIDLDPDIKIHCRAGQVVVEAKAQKRKMEKNKELIKQRLEGLPVVEQFEIQMREDFFERMAVSMR